MTPVSFLYLVVRVLEERGRGRRRTGERTTLGRGRRVLLLFMGDDGRAALELELELLWLDRGVWPLIVLLLSAEDFRVGRDPQLRERHGGHTAVGGYWCVVAAACRDGLRRERERRHPVKLGLSLSTLFRAAASRAESEMDGDRSERGERGKEHAEASSSSLARENPFNVIKTN